MTLRPGSPHRRGGGGGGGYQQRLLPARGPARLRGVALAAGGGGGGGGGGGLSCAGLRLFGDLRPVGPPLRGSTCARGNNPSNTPVQSRKAPAARQLP